MDKLNTGEINQHHPPSQLANWMLIDELVDKYTFVNKSTIRWILLHRHTNQLGPHVRKLGRNIIIEEQGFLSWIDEHAER